jgi:AcrR family transcriptional regulator
MPPKTKITKEDIVTATLNLVRENGEMGLNARNIANKLNCSTQPIFSNFSSLEDLKKVVTERAYNLYLEYLENEVKQSKFPKYKAFGMGYIRFAKQEKELFKFLFMCDRHGTIIPPTQDFNESVKLNMENNGLTEDQAKLFHLEIWTAVHGIATILATNFLDFEWDFISNMISDVYQGLKYKHSTENK